MDVATIIGLLLAFGVMAASVITSGGSFAALWDTPSLLMVVGGTAGAVLMCFPLRTVLRSPRIFLKGIFYRAPRPAELVEQLVSLAKTARRDGLLALERRLPQIDNPLIKLGIQMSIDGTRPEVIEEVLRTHIETMALRHKEGKALFDQLGKYAPAFGLIGTLLGLILMLGNMSDPSHIGSGMAVALVTTLYGAVLSNGSFLPLAEKLAYISKQEMLACEMVVRGIMAIQSGEHPRLIEQKLTTFLPPASRSRLKEAA
jgi:chemotaxis protein MotA